MRIKFLEKLILIVFVLFCGCQTNKNQEVKQQNSHVKDIHNPNMGLNVIFLGQDEEDEIYMKFAFNDLINDVKIKTDDLITKVDVFCKKQLLDNEFLDIAKKSSGHILSKRDQNIKFQFNFFHEEKIVKIVNVN